MDDRLAAGSVFPVFGLSGGLTGLLLPWTSAANYAVAPIPSQSASQPATAPVVSVRQVAQAPARSGPQGVDEASIVSFAAVTGVSSASSARMTDAGRAVLDGNALFRPGPDAPTSLPRSAAPAASATNSPGMGSAGLASVPNSPLQTNASAAMAAPAGSATSAPVVTAGSAKPARTPTVTSAANTASSQAAGIVAAPQPLNGDNTLSVIGNGKGTTEFVVTAANGLYRHDDGAAWTRIGGDGTVLSVSGVSDGSGKVVAFVVTHDHALFQFDNFSGWQMLGAPGTVRTVSAGTDANGAAAAWVMTTDGSFTVYRDSSGWSPIIGAAGSILQFSAARNDHVAVVTSDYAVDEFSTASGWVPRTSSGFAYSVSAINNGLALTLYTVGLDRSLFRYDDGFHWQQFGGPGSIGSVSAGTDASGRPDAYVMTASGDLFELNTQNQWTSIGTAGTVQLVRAANAGRAVVVTADASVYEYSDQSGWGGLTSAGFAAGNVAGPTVTMIPPDFSTSTSGLTATVQVSADDPQGGALQAAIDIDLNGDGSFSDPGDMAAITGPVHPGANTFALPSFSKGTFAMQVRVIDANGHQAVSPIATMVIDPYAGILGSQSLLSLYNSYTAIVGTTSQHAPVSTATQQQTLAALLASYKKQHFVIDPQQRVEVQIRATLGKYIGALQSELQGQGMLVERITPSQNLITGFLPIGAVGSLTGLPHYDAALPVRSPFTNVGKVTSQGVGVIKADTFAAQTGFDGSGVKVGAISDSVNQFDGGLASSQATGDLPKNVQVIQDGPPFSTDEGRAMLEIVHDVAPGASLAFDTDGNTAQDMANSILALANVGSNVITDDVTFLDEPMFNDGVIAKAVEQVYSQGVFYTTSAGNESNHGFFAPWSSVSATVGGISGTFENFGGGNHLQPFSIPVGVTAVVSFQWDAAFLEGGSPLPNYQVPNSVFAYVTNSTGTQIFQPFTDINQNTGEAFQFIVFTNTGGFGTNNFAFAFQLQSGPAPNFIRWVSFDDGGPGDPMASGEGAATIFGHAAARDAVTTAAVNYQTPGTPETYSALGGNLPILFDNNGFRLSTPDFRHKPDLTAPDNVDTTFFIPGNDTDGSGFPNFQGTSAATPHTAGAAALEISENPGNPPGTIVALLEETALDIQAPGFDFTTGFGLIQLQPGVGPGPGPVQPSNLPDDQFELNETSERATDFGTLTGALSFNNLTINVHDNGLPDYDWYRMTAGAAGTFTATIAITPERGDLELHLFTADSNGILTELANSTAPGLLSRSVSAAVQAGQVIFVEVKGHNGAFHMIGTGTYNMTLGLA